MTQHSLLEKAGRFPSAKFCRPTTSIHLLWQRSVTQTDIPDQQWQPDGHLHLARTRLSSADADVGYDMWIAMKVAEKEGSVRKVGWHHCPPHRGAADQGVAVSHPIEESHDDLSVFLVHSEGLQYVECSTLPTELQWFRVRQSRANPSQDFHETGQVRSWSV